MRLIWAVLSSLGLPWAYPSPVIAIGIGLLVSIYGLVRDKSRREVLDCWERGVRGCGTIILITGAGGDFGNIILDQAVSVM